MLNNTYWNPVKGLGSVYSTLILIWKNLNCSEGNQYAPDAFGNIDPFFNTFMMKTIQISSICLWNLLVSYILSWPVHQHRWESTVFVFLASTCRDLWSFHSGPSNAKKLRCSGCKCMAIVGSAWWENAHKHCASLNLISPLPSHRAMASQYSTEHTHVL